MVSCTRVDSTWTVPSRRLAATRSLLGFRVGRGRVFTTLVSLLGLLPVELPELFVVPSRRGLELPVIELSKNVEPEGIGFVLKKQVVRFDEFNQGQLAGRVDNGYHDEVLHASEEFLKTRCLLLRWMEDFLLRQREVMLQIGCSPRTSTASAIPKNSGKAAVSSPPAATTPCRLQQHQQTNTLERCQKRRNLPQSRGSPVLHACALQVEEGLGQTVFIDVMQQGRELERAVLPGSFTHAV